MSRTMFLAVTAAMAFGATSGQAITFAYTGGTQHFTVGPAGLYRIVAAGASGGGVIDLAQTTAVSGGHGWMIGADVPLAAGARLDVIIGGAGQDGLIDPNFPDKGGSGGGGGGGTFILGPGRTPIVVAGGGGGTGRGGSEARGISANGYPNGSAGGYQGNVDYYLGGPGGHYGTGGGTAPSLVSGGGGAGLGGDRLHGDGAYGNGANVGSSQSPGSPAGGGLSANFAGGAGGSSAYALPGGQGGFGGGGGGGSLAYFHDDAYAGTYGGGGGGGGYSGGGGGGVRGDPSELEMDYNSTGGGGAGGSFLMAGATRLLNDLAPNPQGSGRIGLARVFAQGTVRTNTIDFGTARGGSPGVQRTLTVANESPVIVYGGNVYLTSDSIVTTLGALPSAISSGGGIAVLPVSQSGGTTLTLATDRPGVVSGNIAVNFASQAAGGGTAYAVNSGTVAVTGTVTEVAGGILSSSGAGQLIDEFDFDEYAPTYVLDFGNVTAGSTVLSQLSLFNTVTASAFSETLGGTFAGPIDSNGFSFTGTNFAGIVGGTLGGFNTVGFNAAGQSLGQHSEYFEFTLTSNFDGLDPLFLGLYRIGLRANVVEAAVAGVPEPATWGLMIAGFGIIGAAMRRRAVRTA